APSHLWMHSKTGKVVVRLPAQPESRFSVSVGRHRTADAVATACHRIAVRAGGGDRLRTRDHRPRRKPVASDPRSTRAGISPFPPASVERAATIQRWSDASFLHWRVDAAELRP